MKKTDTSINNITTRIISDIYVYFTVFLTGLLITGFTVNAQTGTISGKVTDNKSGEAVFGANILAYSGETFKTGGASDINGSYKLTLEAGRYKLKAVYLGYADFIKTDIIIRPGDDLTLDIALISNGISIVEEVEIHAEPLADYCVAVVDATRVSTASSVRGKRSESKVRSRKSVGAFSSGKASFIDGYGSYSPPAKGVTISADYEYSTGEDLSIDESPAASTNSIIGAGTLTAGEINDFAKWELWEDIAKESLKDHQKHWQMKPTERYSVQVSTETGKPLIDCEVNLLASNGKSIWTGKTDNTGKVELWSDIFNSDNTKSEKFSIEALYQGKKYTLDQVTKFHQGVNLIEIPAICDVPSDLDVLFVVDATGSMGDEINYLKVELDDVINRVKSEHSDLTINLGSIFYRDIGDEYVTRKSDFSSDIKKTTDFIRNQHASGGGDFPEAADSALSIAINDMKWSETARARLLFLVLDAPPHHTPKILRSLKEMSRKAAKKGIRIIPVAGSGIDKSTEYLMRSFALSTNGSYVFLTDHSGVGNPHIEPTTDEYDVEKFNDLLVRLFNQFTNVTPCDDEELISEEQIKDTMFVSITEKIIPETDTIFIIDTLAVLDTTSVDDDTLDTVEKDIDIDIDIIEQDIEPQLSWKYYPNPTSGQLFVELEGDIGELFLADVAGKLLERYKLTDQQKLELDISKYPSGIYFLQYYQKSKEKWVTGRVVLARGR